MPRGKRKSCDEKLGEVQNEIISLELQLKNLRAQEKELLKAKREEELQHIISIMEEKNMTADDLVRILEEPEIQPI